MNKLKAKFANIKFGFAKNIITSIIVPSAIALFALIIGIIFCFNKGIDFNGGIIVSVVAEDYNLEESKEYNEFTNQVNTILNNNGVKGSVYLTEKHSNYQNDVLVVKIEFNGTEQEASTIIEGIKSGLISKFYVGEEDSVKNNHLVEVSTFGASVDSYKIVATILATLVAVIVLCVYVGLRTFELHTSVMALLSSVISCVLATSLIVLTRIQINAYSLSLIPLVSIISAIATFMYAGKVKELLKTGNYERKKNSELAGDAVKQTLTTTLYITIIACVASLIFTFANVTSIVSHFGLSVLVCVIAIAYTNVFIIPALYGLTYVRKVKKEKVKKEQSNQSLNEEEVLKETDLDNLVSN